jgi:hypothetical protein
MSSMVEIRFSHVPKVPWSQASSPEIYELVEKIRAAIADTQFQLGDVVFTNTLNLFDQEDSNASEVGGSAEVP